MSNGVSWPTATIPQVQYRGGEGSEEEDVTALWGSQTRMTHGDTAMPVLRQPDALAKHIIRPGRPTFMSHRAQGQDAMPVTSPLILYRHSGPSGNKINKVSRKQKVKALPPGDESSSCVGRKEPVPVSCLLTLTHLLWHVSRCPACPHGRHLHCLLLYGSPLAMLQG